MTMADHNNNIDFTFDRHFAIGNRFVPTDQELIIHFLLKRINNQDLPRNKMLNVDIYQDHPQKIVDNHRQAAYERNWYFFTPRNRNYTDSNIDRKAGDGYWKIRRSDKEIIDEDGTKIGVKKSFVYHQGNDQIKTDWMMREFVVADDHQRPPLDNKINDYALCKIYKKQNSGGHQQANINQDHHSDPTTLRTPIPDQQPRPEPRGMQYQVHLNPLLLNNHRHPSMGGLQRPIPNHDMRYSQAFGQQVPPPRPNYIVRSSGDFNRSAAGPGYINQRLVQVVAPYRPPPRPHVGLFANEPNHIAVRPSAGFSQSAGPSTSINPQLAPAPMSDDDSWDLTELYQRMNGSSPKHQDRN